MKSLLKSISEGEMMPPRYGIVRRDFVRNRTIVAPIPIHWLIGLYDFAAWKLRTVCVPSYRSKIEREIRNEIGIQYVAREDELREALAQKYAQKERLCMFRVKRELSSDYFQRMVGINAEPVLVGWDGSANWYVYAVKVDGMGGWAIVVAPGGEARMIFMLESPDRTKPHGKEMWARKALTEAKARGLKRSEKL